MGGRLGSWIVGLGLLFVVLGMGGLGRAATLYVSPAGGGDGLSTGSPTTLQSALDTAKNSTDSYTIYLQQGDYNASAVSGFKFLTAGNTAARTVTLSGGWNSAYTLQSGNFESTILNGGNTVRVLEVNSSGTGGSTPIDFKIENLAIENGSTAALGGAGAGLSATVSNGGYLNMYIKKCLIKNNQARTVGSNSGHAGGIYSTCYIELEDTTLESNNSVYYGGAIWFSFAAPYTKNLIAKVNRCNFINNSLPTSGQGTVIYFGNDLTVSNCNFEGNSGVGSVIFGAFGGATNLAISNCRFHNNQGQYWGSAIQLWGTPGTVTNCLFTNNQAGLSGDGASTITMNNFVAGSYTANIINCTFVGNRTQGYQGYGGAIVNSGQTVNIQNSVFWDNGTYYPIYFDAGSGTISYSDIQGGFTTSGTNFTDGGNNATTAPVFVGGGSYELASTSTCCIDTGTNSPVVTLPTTDLKGNKRIMDGNNDGNAIVDMGPYEYDPLPNKLQMPVILRN